MSARRPALFVLLAAALTLRPQSPSPGINIVNPANGAIVGSDKHLTLQAQLDPAFINTTLVEVMNFTAVKTDQSVMFNLDQGNLRSIDGQDIAETIWDLSTAPTGSYFVTAQMQDHAGNHYQSTIQVTVDRAPSVRVSILSQSRVPGGVQVSFFPDAEDPDGDSISEITWTPGDGGPSVTLPDSTPYTHVYAGTAGQNLIYILDALFQDSRGAQADAIRDVVVENAAAAGARQTNDCGCTGMTIVSSRMSAGAAMPNNSGTYCWTGAANALPRGCMFTGAAGAGGCATGRPFSCALGPSVPAGTGMPAPNNFTGNLGWRFEITATLDPRTNAQPDQRPGQWRNYACQEGQAVQVTRVRNGTRVAQPTVSAGGPNPPPLPGPLPTVVAQGVAVNGKNATLAPPAGQKPPVGNAGNVYGGDDYAWVRGDGKVHDFANRVIRWMDAPGLTYTPAANPSLNDDAIFVAWVGGDNALSTCWCQFQVQHTWTPAAGRTGGTTVRILNGNNCTGR